MGEAGFFHRTELRAKPPAPLTARCGSCGLFRDCNSPKMLPYGSGKKRVLIVGEAPGATEDQQGRPFVGKTGQYLRRVLAEIGVNPDRDCWITNSLICRPPGNATPTDRQIEWCRPNLTRTLQELKPEVIILLGKAAIKSLIGSLWKEDVGDVERWVGWQIPCKKLNAWICPTWHPSHIVREEQQPALALHFARHLERAFALEGRPWKTPPDYRKKCRVLFDVEQASEWILSLLKTDTPIAFDLECDAVKSDREDRDIICASVCDGKESIAFPWHGSVIGTMKKFLQSPLPKIGWNIKYEARWIYSKLGIWVENWTWCGMTAAHVLDNRSGITGLKFQSFVQLGQESYDDLLKPYMDTKGQGGNARNRLRECPLAELLRYCALDSLLEFKLAEIQSEKMGMSLT